MLGSPVLLALTGVLVLAAGRLVAATTPSWAPLVVAAGEASRTASVLAGTAATHVRTVALPVGAAAQSAPLLVLLALAAAVVAEIALVATHRGSVDHPLPWRRTAVVSFAATKLGALTPAQSGDLALRMRFLHREGVDRPAAVRSLAVRSSGTGAVQTVVAGVALLAVGSSLASPTQVLHVAGGVAVMLLVLAGVLPVRPAGCCCSYVASPRTCVR